LATLVGSLLRTSAVAARPASSISIARNRSAILLRANSSARALARAAFSNAARFAASRTSTAVGIFASIERGEIFGGGGIVISHGYGPSQGLSLICDGLNEPSRLGEKVRPVGGESVRSASKHVVGYDGGIAALMNLARVFASASRSFRDIR
jgi:hypothetical protein